MRAVPVAFVPVLALVLLAPACSSSSGQPAVRVGTLRARLVTGAEVDLPGYTATTPAGEQQPATATAIRYFTLTSGFRQVTVTLVGATTAAKARAASDTAFSTALDSLRNAASTSITFGTAGHEVVGRTKGYGALQDSVYFVEGTVAVSVTLSSGTPDQPSGVALAVARAQDAKLRAG